jgi:hypothetical protein
VDNRDMAGRDASRPVQKVLNTVIAMGLDERPTSMRWRFLRMGNLFCYFISLSRVICSSSFAKSFEIVLFQCGTRALSDSLLGNPRFSQSFLHRETPSFPDPLLHHNGARENAPKGVFLSLTPLWSFSCFLETELSSFLSSWISL